MKEFFQVDAFTTRPFHGNTAAVVLLAEPLELEIMQDLAAQHRLPAIAFVQPGEDVFHIRWFSPGAELLLCGHASLAAAHVLFSKKLVAKNETIRFVTPRDNLYAQYADGWIQLDFPCYDNRPVSVPADLEAIFTTNIRAAAETQGKYIIELQTEADVRNFSPDFAVLKNHKCMITSRADAGAGYDFVSRYFAGPDGIAEDAVTGSSHCSLVLYWSERLGKTDMHARQLSARGGDLRLALRNNRVLIGGQAVTVAEGRILV